MSISTLKTLNKKLEREFGGQVFAGEENGCLVLNGKLDNWEDVTLAGALAARSPFYRKAFKRGVYDGFVNNIEFTGGKIPPMKLPSVADMSLDGLKPDILVIGGGITGCAIARELTRWKTDVLLVEKEHDVAMHASCRNDGMVHPGIDLLPGTLKFFYNKRGNVLYPHITRELGVPFERVGQYLCFGAPLFKPILYASLLYWKRIGIVGVQVVGKRELHKREPGLRKDLDCALFFPTAGIVCPYSLVIAYAENAVQNGAKISLDTAVLGMETKEGRILSVTTNRGVLFPKVVVNAAGVFADEIAAMAGDKFFSIHPRKGTNAILDKKFTSTIVKSIVSRLGTFSVKTHTKGGGIVRTAHGNVLVGPDARETFERENFSTSRESIAAALNKFKQTSAVLNEGQIITYFTGVRAPTYEEDFVICKGKRTSNIVHAAGIQSPGLTAAPAIAQDVARFAVELFAGSGPVVPENENFNPIRPPIPHIAAMSYEERDALIRQNSDFGVIVCRCEEVSRGEILESLRRPVPCDTVDGVKRRVRPGSGRCQGGFCGPLVLRIIAEEKACPPEAVLKSVEGSNVTGGRTK
ncbi:MAG: NAD(P)/FAD-dependent oxidoreductase [Treponema sp.]|jgi:glycerol-3-phosphate dehydrogenase|nr:NAD(P)/FAD-dependent oxidoreductase [Treponema sp.]